ncbi:MAG: B12-binding domain-containing radical SAM protein [Polyangiaceae bacterium]
MRVLLVWPKFDSFSFWNFEKVCEMAGVKYMTPPLGLLTVAALLPRSWDLRLVDENVRPLEGGDLDWADIVFVGSKIVHRGRALEVIREAKAHGKRVVVGGPDPTMSPQFYTEVGADFLCQGEGETVVPELLADLTAGKTSGVYSSEKLPDMTQSPVPRFDLIDHRDYLYVGVQYSRGCPYHCEFCNVIDLFKNEYRTKTIDQVLKELDLLYELGYRGQLDFFDDNLVGHMKDVKPLLRALADWLKAHKYPFSLSTSLTLNAAKDPEILALLREARFKYFLVGIETPDENALKHAKKPHNTGFSIAEAAERFYREAGATLHSGFLLGLDGEPQDIADRIMRCIDEASIPWVMAGVVYPLPGTALSKRLDREGRLFPKARFEIADGARDQISAGIQFKTERPAEEVLEDLVRVMHHAFDPEQYFKRCADVAVKLNTVPNVMPGTHIFLRNTRTFLRLMREMARESDTRGPFFKALARVLLQNRAGIEALATLSVLYVHFRSMLPYVYEKLGEQLDTLRTQGNEAWLKKNLAETEATAARRHLAVQPGAA